MDTLIVLAYLLTCQLIACHLPCQFLSQLVKFTVELNAAAVTDDDDDDDDDGTDAAAAAAAAAADDDDNDECDSTDYGCNGDI